MTHDRPAGYYASRLDARVAAELLGTAKGVVFDRAVNLDEMAGLSRWLDEHPEAQSSFPGRELAARLQQIYADGVVTPEEQQSLLEYLTLVTGAPVSGNAAASDRPTALPFDRPPPTLMFSGGNFVLTGNFAFGTRQACIDLTRSLGGVVKTSVSRSIDYLVVGALGSEEWITSAYGRKIEKGVELRDSGSPLAIVDEAHWLEEARRSPGAL